MPRARYKQLVDALAADIRSGKLSPGTQLPTHRQLAQSQKIALVTASRVYAELESMGLVSGETGRGTFVREPGLPPGHGIDQQPVPPGTVDLNFNSPSLAGQDDRLRESLRTLSRSGDLERILHYQPHAGHPHERSLVARYLERRGLRVCADQLLITSGAQHGLATAVLGLLDPGDVIAVDALIYPGFKTVAEVSRVELAPVPCSSSGPDLDTLAQLCRQRRVKAIYSQPTLHNPLGWVLTQRQREALVSIARKEDLILIEDAAYAFLVDNAPPPLCALAPERTIYINSLSKVVATGLRIGFITAPRQWIPRLERVIRATTWNTPGLITTLACQWIEDGSVERLEAEKRQDALMRQSLARKIFIDMDYVSHPSGYFLWLPLPCEVRADQVAATLLQQGISVATAAPFATTEQVPHALRLALGSVDYSRLEASLLTVKQVIKHYAGLAGTL